ESRPPWADFAGVEDTEGEEEELKIEKIALQTKAAEEPKEKSVYRYMKNASNQANLVDFATASEQMGCPTSQLLDAQIQTAHDKKQSISQTLPKQLHAKKSQTRLT
uniref:Uncharacterized protein n=1 Tax=Acrobeloides nanus TaxID=290746 RepID=A0A914DF39_9BILA